MDPSDSAPITPADPVSPVAPVEEGVTPAPPAPAEGEKPADPAVAEPDPKDPATAADPVDPEKSTAPAEGEKPADPDAPVDSVENENQPPDLKSMSRAERAQYFQGLEATTRKVEEARVDKAYQPQPIDELKQKYVDQGHTEFEASMLAREEIRDQEADISRARAERAELNAKLAIESTEILSTVGWLNPDNKSDYDKDSSDAAIQLYDELCLTRDDNTLETDENGKPIPGSGQIIGATMTPKQFFGLVDKIRSSGTEVAKLSAQKAAEEQMAAVAPSSSNSNKTEKPFDQLSTDEQRKWLTAQGHIVT